jgi:hypothetical protein
VAIAADVPDSHALRIDVTATDDQGHSWSDYFTITAWAPVLGIVAVAVNDDAGNDNGALDPGETANLELVIENHGGAEVLDLIAVLSSVDPFITLGDAAESLGILAPGGTATAIYPVTVDLATPPGHIAAYRLDFTGGDYAACDSFDIRIGLECEDFETGDFSSYPWVMGGDAPWTITSTGAYEGAYAAVSGDIGDSQSSTIMVALAVAEQGTLSFHYRVSSEAAYDFLRFYIDGQPQLEASGNVSWAEADFIVGEGGHTFEWRYQKDYSVSNGSDCAWVDHIVFPALADTVVFPDIEVSPLALDVSLAAGDTHTEQLVLENSGGSDLAYSVSVTTRGRDMTVKQSSKLTKGETDPRRGVAMPKSNGGPDGHGYRWMDSDEPSGPSYEWIDISSIGTIPGTSDDGNYGPFDLGFPFEFYGTEHTTVRICANGWLSFTSVATSLTNEEIPCDAEPNDLIAPFWDDLDPSSGGNIYYYSDGANGRFIAQWDHVPRYSSTPDTASYTFQAVLYADGRIVYQYNSLTGPVESCTVGTEDGAGMDGLQVVFNQACLHDGLAIMIEPGEPWLTVMPAAGSVEPGSTETLTVTFGASGLSDGTYEGTITVSSNDPDEPAISIPVSMLVEGVPTTDNPAAPARLVLEVAPNPFSASCRFEAGPGGTYPHGVQVYDIMGNLVWRWASPHQSPGGPVTWVPGPTVGSGIYIVRATVGDQADSRRIVYVR